MPTTRSPHSKQVERRLMANAAPVVDIARLYEFRARCCIHENALQRLQGMAYTLAFVLEVLRCPGSDWMPKQANMADLRADATAGNLVADPRGPLVVVLTSSARAP
jgi:hypothetical protein